MDRRTTLWQPSTDRSLLNQCQHVYRHHGFITNDLRKELERGNYVIRDCHLYRKEISGDGLTYIRIGRVYYGYPYRDRPVSQTA